jgi:hypothetical protein
MKYPKTNTVMSENIITEKTKTWVENPCSYLSLQVAGLIPVETCQYPRDANTVMCNKTPL